MGIYKPPINEYPLYYDTYIGKVTITDDLTRALRSGQHQVTTYLKTIPSDKLEEYRYQQGKWTIKEIILHLMDAERIFAYRALRFARQDMTPLDGFDENEYAPNSGASLRSLQSLIDEYEAQRQSTILLFENMTEKMTITMGNANGRHISVRALGYTIAGHEIHHLNVIRERYL